MTASPSTTLHDLFLTAGPDYDEQALPPGFFQDRQRNQRNRGQLTLYLNHDVMEHGLRREPLQGKLGFRIYARPEMEPDRPRLVFYRPLEYHGSIDDARTLMAPNETTRSRSGSSVTWMSRSFA